MNESPEVCDNKYHKSPEVLFMEVNLLFVLEDVLHYLVDVFIILFELVGVMIIIIAGVQGIRSYLGRRPDIKLTLAQGLATGLEFKLGSEILRTVIVRDWKEIATVAGIIALRAALTFLIHWEIKEERKDSMG